MKIKEELLPGFLQLELQLHPLAHNARKNIMAVANGDVEK